MALAIDGSSPAKATATPGPTVNSPSFTPPAGSLLLIMWNGDSPNAPHAAPTITDSLGTHLTYEPYGWHSQSDSPGVFGQVAIWVAVVGSSAAMTVSVTNGASSHQSSELNVTVITGQDDITYVGAFGHDGSASASAISQNYVAPSSGGWGFLTACDWDALGTDTAGSGCTIDAGDAGTIAGVISYASAHRTTPDDSNGGTNTLNISLPGASTNLSWAWIELLPAGQPPNTDPPGPFLPAYLTYQLALLAQAKFQHTVDPDPPPNLIDPASASVTTVATVGPTVTSPTFTAPAGALIVVGFSGDTDTTNPATPTITDNLGTHLLYKPGPWQSHADTPTVFGQSALWTAQSTGAAMTITVTNGSPTHQAGAIHVWWTLLPGCSVGTTGKAGSASLGTINQSYTPVGTGSQAVLVTCDWDNKGAQVRGNSDITLDGSAVITTEITYGFAHRKLADDVAGVANNIGVILPATSTNLGWVWLEILPPTLPALPTRTTPVSIAGTQWWQQPTTRLTELVTAAPAVTLPAPLDVAYGAGGVYWHLYADGSDPRIWQPQQRVAYDPSLLSAPVVAIPTATPVAYAAYADRRQTTQQRPYLSDPNLLATAELEGALLGSADTVRHVFAAAYTDRRMVAQQRAYTDPTLLGPAQLENELLGGADTARHNPAAYADRREVAQQRPYISAVGLLATALLDELLGSVDDQRRRQIAAYYDRREVPQQRAYVSDPLLLATAELEGAILGQGDVSRHQTWFTDRRSVGQQRTYPLVPVAALLELELLGGGDTVRHLTWFTDRRGPAAQRMSFDPSLLTAAVTDPITLAAGVGGDMWRRINVAAYADRREVPQQPGRVTVYFDAGPGSPPLTLAWGVGGDLWHRYNPRRPVRAWWPAWSVPALLGDICITLRPGTGSTTRPSSGVTVRVTATTTRPSSGVTLRPDSGTTSDPC